MAGALWAREAGISGPQQTYPYLEICGALLGFFFSANALVRFRSTHDRATLILAAGFAVAGILEMASSLAVAEWMATESLASSPVPVSWMVGGTLLGLFFLVAIGAERWMPASRQPGREIGAALIVVAIIGYVANAALPATPAAPPAESTSLLSHPGELLPALLFLGAAFFCLRRLKRSARAYDYALVGVTLLNAGSHASAGFSVRFFDGPFFLAEACKTLSYGVMLAGAVLEQERLFEQAQTLAISDSLTGLANYRRLLSVLHWELDRARRAGKPFSVILLDMDSLKAVNDEFGHLVGSRALCRLASVLRMNSRTIDTAARYGGDEFTLVLPEAGGEIAARVVERIRERLQRDGEMPRLSVSAGIAVFPADGGTPEELLSAADKALYGMKDRRGVGHLQSIARIAACL